MVSSPNYDRVKELLQLGVKPEGEQDTEERTVSSDVRTAVDEAKGTSEEFQRDKSVGQSQTKEGADGWMARFGVESNRHLETIRSSKAHHETLRIKMAGFVEQGASLSPTLIEPLLEHLRHSGELVTIPVDMRGMFGGAVEATGRAYIAALERAKNKEREEAAQAILDQLNSAGKEHATTIQTPIPDPHEQPVPVPDDDDKPVPPRPSPRRPVNPVPRPGEGGVRNVSGGVSGLTGGGSGVSGWVRPSGDELGSISNPITDPDDLSHIDLARTPINARMTPNGPVGGHMPADVLNIDDPAWRAAPPSSGGAARIAGGTLVAGSAAGMAGGFLARGGGYGGIAGMTPGAALRPTAPAGGVLGRGGAGSAGLRSGMAPVGSGGSGGSGAGRGGASGAAGRGGAAASRGGAGVVGRGGASGVVGREVGAGSARGGAGAAGRGGAGTAGRGGVSGVVGREGGAGSARGGAGAAGRGGAGTAGRGGVSGVVGREVGAGSARGGAGTSRGGAGVVGRGGAPGAGVAGRGGAGGRGVLGGGSSAGRGEKKKETQRRNYDVVRIDGIEEQSKGLVGGAAGSADQLKPLSRDSGEDW